MSHTFLTNRSYLNLDSLSVEMLSDWIGLERVFPFGDFGLDAEDSYDPSRKTYPFKGSDSKYLVQTKGWTGEGTQLIYLEMKESRIEYECAIYSDCFSELSEDTFRFFADYHPRIMSAFLAEWFYLFNLNIKVDYSQYFSSHQIIELELKLDDYKLKFPLYYTQFDKP